MAKKLKVLVIGSGGREHAIVKAVKSSPMLESLVCAPANGGIAEDCAVANIEAHDIEKICAYVSENKIDFVICGPEVPLSMGLGDKLRASGTPVYGPNKNGAILEASKAFSKDFMKRHNVPTARYENFTDFEKAKKYILESPFDVVVKASGLAAGKGVIVPNTKEEAVAAAKDMLLNSSFGASGAEVVIEEKLVGEESSIMLVVSGVEYVMLPPSQDHKRVGDGDTGANTGGMGAYAPAAVADAKVLEEVRSKIISPVLKGLIAEGVDYRGTLYVGIMITNEGSKVIEFNARFGDPECQILMPLIESDVLEMLYDAACGKLDASKVKIKDEFAAIVVVCAKGYPDAYKKGDIITFPKEIAQGSYIIHAGTKSDGKGNIVTNGGRVLGMTANAKTLEEALQKAYKLCNETHFDGAFFRKDIAHRQLARNKNKNG